MYIGPEHVDPAVTQTLTPLRSGFIVIESGQGQ